MRTRLLAATLTALAAVSLAACSSSGSSSGKATTAAGSPTTTATPSDASTGSAAATPATSAPSAPSASATADGATGAPAGSSPGADGSAPAKPAPPADAGLPAKPDSDLTGKVVAALNAIDPAIVGGKPDQVVEQARKQCQSMYQFPKDKAKLIELANQHFTSPDHPQGFGPDTAAKINDALRTTLCPSPR
ncbi:hypothetical protein ACIRYZ_04035 [Kitasatospora sp. NPDC101155]|uniref:hypothetical protein n=1 Tax=Kitasatospora sp. NPDC101155 TaxID=3364097 RepID=UPI0037FFF627